MIAHDPRYMHPIDTEKLLAGMVPTTIHPSDVGRGVVSSGFMVTLCGKCNTPSPLTGRQIDFVHVCDYCYELHRISSNRLPCPYKQPRSRKSPARPETLKFELSQGQTEDGLEAARHMMIGYKK